MSDSLRKDFSTKAQEGITPDSAKSTQDKIKESVTDAGDRIQRGLQPDDSKGAGQSAADKAQRMTESSGDQSSSGGSIGDKVKDALGLNK